MCSGSIAALQILENRPEKPDWQTGCITQPVLELHGISHGCRSKKHRHNGSRGRLPDGALACWRTRKERMGLVSCQRQTYRYKRGGHEHVALLPNYLERQFAVTEPNRVWCGGVGYIWTGKRWAYLAGVLDLFARKPVGWAMSFSPDQQAYMKALEMAWEAVVSPSG